eukprot:NODE_1193_length_1246_cov_57.934837_g971_i0.p1 GENE.NODE_1193_length_1246_cov_57.934837_g971_i0~~NODE_1193_length_1246_cov_57.934837_g971_i0.p1  ORF type:complete len:210 (+),score=41.84 NODE_1193_length_1246_cov_57.934837_g971_i0:596-1225(+)
MVCRSTTTSAGGRIRHHRPVSRTTSLSSPPEGCCRAPLYLDLGAREFNSSVRHFLDTHPSSEAFEVHAWEAVSRWASSYQGHPRVVLHQEAAWVEYGNVSMQSPDMAYMAGGGIGKFSVPSIDFSDYLQRNVVSDDFVVCKMDIEGAEFQIVPKLLREGTIHLIDELHLECHYYFMCRLPVVRDKSWRDCNTMMTGLRGAGVFVHEWMN